ncbi:MAG: hypothetical protein M0Z50_11215 [Planctomycetia bacterium]|nr:hypothetical protein [Planctomycetia bacterium]
MGADPYCYFVDYESDTNAALQRLREREFRAGRYNPVMSYPGFMIKPQSPAPGAQHATIEQAIAAAGEDGTRSILDLRSVGDSPDFGVAARVPEEKLEMLFETTQPTHEMIESELSIFDDLDRGHGACIVVYKDGKPSELFFAGYSYD